MIAVSFDTAIYQWRAGERRLAEAEPPESVALERVTSRIHAELRRRLGGPFTVDELVALYDGGTGWCLDLAYAVTKSLTASGVPEGHVDVLPHCTHCDVRFFSHRRDKGVTGRHMAFVVSDFR